MFKFILLALAIYVLYKLFANDFLRKAKENKVEEEQEKARKIAAGEMVKDPVCGVYVAVESSISVRDGEKSYHFCSYECRDNFLKKLECGDGVDLKQTK